MHVELRALGHDEGRASEFGRDTELLWEFVGVEVASMRAEEHDEEIDVGGPALRTQFEWQRGRLFANEADSRWMATLLQGL